MRNHILSKQLVKPNTKEIYDNGTLQSEMSSKQRYDNLAITETGLQFDLHSIYEQSIRKLDNNRTPVSEPEVKDRSFTNRYVLSKRQSTGELLGFTYACNADGTPKGGGYEMWVRVISVGDKSLKWKQGIILYDDLYSGDADQQWRSGAYEMTLDFTVDESGKVVLDVTDVGFDVDPKSMVRKPSSETERSQFVSEASD